MRLGGRGVRLGVELPKLTEEFVVGFISQHVDAIFLVCKTQSIGVLVNVVIFNAMQTIINSKQRNGKQFA